MKQFIIEWCINMIIGLALVGYIGIFFLVCYLLDSNTLKGVVYLFFVGFILCCNYRNTLCEIL